MKWGCSFTAEKNTLNNTIQEWIRSAVMPLRRRYRTDILSQDLCRLSTRFYIDTLFPKANSVSRHDCYQIFTDGERIICIIPFFSKAEVGMAIISFMRQVGILNELHFGKAADQMGPHSNFQFAMRELSIEWINLEPFSPWQNHAENQILKIKGRWKRRKVCRRISKNCWSFGLVWEAGTYSCTLYKVGTTGM